MADKQRPETEEEEAPPPPRDLDLANRAVTLATRREQRALEELRETRALAARLRNEAERWPNRSTSPS